MRPHKLQPTRLPRPWDSPGKNTGVGCHFLLQCLKVKSESEVAQSCPTVCNPMDCSPPGFSVHRILQAGILEWDPPRDISNPGIKPGQLPAVLPIPISTCCSYHYAAAPAAAAAAKSLQSCPTLCDPIDGSPPGSAVPGILQARTLEWVAISFSNA